MITDNSGLSVCAHEYVLDASSQMCADIASSLVHRASFHFLCLPAEIRNMIYVYALGGNTWSIKMTQDTTGATIVRVENGIRNALSLLKVNRQIHAEAHLFPYLYNIFAGVHSGHLLEWVKSLTDTQRTSIKAIKRYQRGYIVYDLRTQDLSVSPLFWMDMPQIADWGLDGLRRIEVEAALQKWGWRADKEKLNRVLLDTMVKLRSLVEAEHPNVTVKVVSRRGYWVG